MEYFTKALFRTNIQNIREYLENGVELEKMDEKSSVERWTENEKKLHELFRRYVADSKEYERVGDEITKYIGEAEYAYMEVGIKCGFLLTIQMLKDFL